MREPRIIPSLDWENAARDEVISRSAENGTAGTYCPPVAKFRFRGKPYAKSLDLMNPAFRQRVDEAITALKRGESATSIRERHGIIVLRQAQELL